MINSNKRYDFKKKKIEILCVHFQIENVKKTQMKNYNKIKYAVDSLHVLNVHCIIHYLHEYAKNSIECVIAVDKVDKVGVKLETFRIKQMLNE